MLLQIIPSLMSPCFGPPYVKRLTSPLPEHLPEINTLVSMMQVATAILEKSSCIEGV